MPPPLAPDERIYYRDRMRQARYAALEESEGFHLVCYALEELGIRLLGRQEDMGQYSAELQAIVAADMNSVPNAVPAMFSCFPGLFRIVREARNDAMHTGAYARQVTGKAIELCLLLEDALMNGNGQVRRVGDHMVKEPICIEPWHPVARARQLMLTHSFSNLPILLDDKWHLLNELGLAKYLLGRPRKNALGASISSAREHLGLIEAPVAPANADIRELLHESSSRTTGTALWVVVGQDQRLLGVISAFEML
jgi:CBS domain-containing protein